MDRGVHLVPNWISTHAAEALNIAIFPHPEHQLGDGRGREAQGDKEGRCKHGNDASTRSLSDSDPFWSSN